MKVDLKKFESGWHAIYLGLTKKEINEFIDFLISLKNEKSDHFHISNNYDNDSMVGDIEIYLKNDEEPDNIYILK